MNNYKLYGVLLQLSVITLAASQRVAPGVPPQHYQQPPPQYQQQQPQVPHHQQQQQQQQQYHPPPQQQHQPPPQQHYQPPPGQQQVNQQQHGAPPHQGGGHHHDHHGQPQQVLNANVQQEKQHIAEHLEVPMDTSKMTEQELQFHYFKMHDADNNNKLDGCELIKSLLHWHDQEGQKTPNEVHTKNFDDHELEALVDPILKSDDTNNDGYIGYPEFVFAQQRSQGGTSGHSGGN